MNMMMMSDENHRDIYISTVAMPPLMYCPGCRDMALAHPGERASDLHSQEEGSLAAENMLMGKADVHLPAWGQMRQAVILGGLVNVG